MELYRTYTAREAAALLAEGQPTEWTWDRQLALLPAAAALFAETGPPEFASHFQTPSEFRFRPGASFHVEPGEFDWMPAALTSKSRERREVELLIREGDNEYRYVGSSVLAMYTGASDYQHQYADFSLAERLPKDLWLRYGGYSGWKATLAHEDYLLDPGDETGLQALLDRARDEEDLHFALTRYDEDQLSMLANRELAYLSYQNVWGGEELSCNPAHDPDTEEVAPFFCSCGAALEMPLCYVVSREAAVAAVREFFRTGAQPASIEWCEDE